MPIDCNELVSFEEAVRRVQADPSADFFSFQFNAKRRFLGGWLIASAQDDDEPDRVSVMFEGGELFDAGGEEDDFEVDKAPKAAKALRYLAGSAIPEVSFGMVADHVAWRLFPDVLQSPMELRSRDAQDRFASTLEGLIASTFGKPW